MSFLHAVDSRRFCYVYSASLPSSFETKHTRTHTFTFADTHTHTKTSQTGSRSKRTQWNEMLKSVANAFYSLPAFNGSMRRCTHSQRIALRFLFLTMSCNDNHRLRRAFRHRRRAATAAGRQWIFQFFSSFSVSLGMQRFTYRSNLLLTAIA